MKRDKRLYSFVYCIIFGKTLRYQSFALSFFCLSSFPRHAFQTQRVKAIFHPTEMKSPLENLSCVKAGKVIVINLVLDLYLIIQEMKKKMLFGRYLLSSMSSCCCLFCSITAKWCLAASKYLNTTCVSKSRKVLF